MVPTKKSDRLIGFLGILQALLLIWTAQLVVEDAIELQEMTNNFKDDTIDRMECDELEGDEECEEIVADITGWVDGVQSDVVIWQALYAFLGIVGVLFLLISFRLMTGTEILLNSLFTNQNRSLFFYSTLFIIVLGYAIGMFEASMMNSMWNEMYEMFEKWGSDMDEKPAKAGAMDGNAAVVVFGNAIFLLFNGLIGLLTRGPINGAETAVPAEVKELSGETELDDLLPPE